MQIGDIFYSAWGWEQTNIDYYQVIGVTDKMITVSKIGSINTPDSDGHTGYSIPDVGNFSDEKPLRRKLIVAGDRVFIKINTYAYAYPVEFVMGADGEKIYNRKRWTAYA